LQTSPRSGVFYINSKGNKVYVKSQGLKSPQRSTTSRSPQRSTTSRSPQRYSTVRSPQRSTSTGLNPQQEKFCRCLKHVESKGGVYNPFSVCAKSVGTTLGRGKHCPK